MMRLALFLLPLGLAACGDLPQPFLGRPGYTAERLANQPPPARLAVPTPASSLLGDEASAAWAGDMARALRDKAGPAGPRAGAKGDWSLDLSAHMQGASGVPGYEIRDPQGKAQGDMDGTPVPLAAWAGGDPAVLQGVADSAAPKITDLLTRIQAARLRADPNSLFNRPARIYFSGVTGAPGDGDTSLARQMRLKLADQGVVVQDTPRRADFTLSGLVLTTPAAKGMEQVEIRWNVHDAAGHDRGQVAQLNEIPADSISRFWGDVSVAVAAQAAGGVREVLAQAGAPRRDAGHDATMTKLRPGAKGPADAAAGAHP